MKVLQYTQKFLLPERPVHLLGIGDIKTINASIAYGIDTFDSSYPTRAARHGVAFVESGQMKLTRTAYRDYHRPIDESCECYTCQRYTVSYIHHLFKAKEATALTLTSIHNLHHMMKMMKNIRKGILEDKI